MINLIGKISPIQILALLILGVILKIVLWAARKYLPMIINFPGDQRAFRLWSLRIEVLLWGSFSLFTLYQLFTQSPLFSVILLVLILVPAWPFWRDFFPGLLFRTEGIADRGDRILFKEEICSIDVMDFRYLKLRTSAGNVILVPYRDLGEITFTQALKKGKTNDYSFSLSYPGKGEDEAIAEIRRFILESPWSIPMKSVSVTSEGEEGYKIRFSASDESIAQRLKKGLIVRVGSES